MVRALSSGIQPTAVFRDTACAALRLTRERGRIECDALAALFEDALTSDDRRTLILDLLALAGTPDAQSAMRRLLSSAAARRDSRTFASFVQRLGFMERPDGATLRFLISVYAESKHESPEVRAACAYALGAGVGRAHVWGLTNEAMRASEVLRHDLLRATNAVDKCALVTALGTAALECDVERILRFASDSESRVRSAAVLALKKMHTMEARASLLTLLTTSDESVAESALSALFEQTLVHEEIVRLAELVLAGRTPLALDERILRLIVTQKLNVIGQRSLDTVEDAINLLLSRIEVQATRHGSTVRPAAPATTRRADRSSTIPPPPRVADRTHAVSEARSNLVSRPKTALPYSAGYRMVSQIESAEVAERFVGELHVSDAPALEPVTIEPVPASIRTDAQLVSGELRRTLSYGALREAIRIATEDDSIDAGWDALADSVPPNVLPPALPTILSMEAPKLESDIRSLSAVNVPVPIVPLAIIR
jgi:HEAT repeat protein